MDSSHAHSPAWHRHLNVKSYAAFLVICGALAAAVGVGFYRSNLSWFEINKGEEKTAALQLVNAFVTVYSDVRKQFMTGEAPVPASFRAHAIGKFNESRNSTGTLRLSMVGVPGREIKIPPSDAQVADAIRAFLGRTAPAPHTQFVEVGGEPVLRTVYPSIASQQSCVDCHNKLQAGRETWKLNDVMGAFVAEVPAGAFLAQSRRDAILAGLLVMLTAAGVGSAIFFMHARQLARGAETEAGLRQAHEELKAAVNKLATQERLAAIGQMAGTVSHELRNPLGVIQNSVAIVRQMTNGRGLSVERPLDRMERSIERCTRIIGELLHFTRDGDLHRERLGLDAWLEGVLDDYASPESVAIERDLRSGGTAAIDTHRFQQVVTNLIDNACHALADPKWQPPAGQERRVVVRSEAAGPHLRLSIHDNGPGIAADVLPKIFEPLFTTKSFGTGLGLPTVRKIVEQHGGAIEVESTPGQGTTFIIRLAGLNDSAAADMAQAEVAA